MNKPKEKVDIEIENLEIQKGLLGYKGADRIISSHEKVEDIKASESADKLNFRIMSKIELLDSYLEGFRLGTVNVVSGPTGEGKTTWTQTLTRNFATQGINSVWFSFEVMPAEFFSKFGNSVPLFYLPKEIPEQSNLVWIKTRILEAQAKHNIKVVFIDHLHYLAEMQGLSTTDKTSLLIGDIMRKLKRISIEFGVAIFLIVHVKSDAGNQAEVKKYYTKDDIRDSSFVKQEADTVTMIWRKRRKATSEVGWEYTDNAIINLDKHRRTGKVGFVALGHKDNTFTALDSNRTEEVGSESQIDYDQIEKDAAEQAARSQPNLL